jgi:acetyltransferase
MRNLFMEMPKTFNEVKEIPQNYPSDWVEEVVLQNDLQVTVRPIRPDDAIRLQEGFKRLSSQSRYLRFLETSNELSDKQARELSELDYDTRMALVAEIAADERVVLVGVARYARLTPEHPDWAECAIVVADEIQKRGLGSLLMNRLGQYAARHGVKVFVGTVHLTNTTMLRFIKRAGLPYEKTIIEPGIWEVRVQLRG